MVISPISTWDASLHSVGIVNTRGLPKDLVWTLVVTEIGIVTQPNRQRPIEHFQGLDVPQYTIKEITRKSIQHRWKPRTQFNMVIKWLRSSNTVMEASSTLFAMFNSLFD